jgi:hypothetical protein
MLREILSVFLGAGVASTFWWAAIQKDTVTRDAGILECVPEPVEQVGILASGEVPFSSQPQGRYPGIKLYNTDFLVPLNRITLTRYAFFDDPDGFYGSGGAPCMGGMFIIEEKGKRQYFMTSAQQEQTVWDVVYLGEDIDIEKAEMDAGFYVIDYKNRNGQKGNACVAAGRITGEYPVEDPGVAQKLEKDLRKSLVRPWDTEPFEGDLPRFFYLLQDAVRKNNKAALAGMVNFPITINDWTYYTREEFIEDYDQIFSAARRKAILDSTFDDVHCGSSGAWEGAEIPGDIWCWGAKMDKPTPIGIINRFE